MSQLEKYKIKYYKCKQQKQEMLQVGGAGPTFNKGDIIKNNNNEWYYVTTTDMEGIKLFQTSTLGEHLIDTSAHGPWEQVSNYNNIEDFNIYIEYTLKTNILKYNDKLIVVTDFTNKTYNINSTTYELNQITKYIQFNPADQTWTEVTADIEFNHKNLSIATDDEIKPLMEEVRKFKIYMPGDIVVNNTNGIYIEDNLSHVQLVLNEVLTTGDKITQQNINNVVTSDNKVLKINNKLSEKTITLNTITQILYQNNKQINNPNLFSSYIQLHGALFDLTQRTKLTPGVTPLYNILTNQLVVYQKTNPKGTKHFDTYIVKDINGKDETYSGVTLVPFDIQKQMNYHTEKADLQETLLSVPNTGLSANMFLPM